MKRTVAVLLLTLSAACSRGNDGPAAVTAGEEKALDEAAQMIEARQLSPGTSAPASEPAQSN